MKLKFYTTSRILLLFIVTLLITVSAYSQSCAGLTATYSTTESRCIATGSIQINATGGSGTYNYKVQGPSPAAFTSSSLITGLQAGSYTVTVKDIVSNCTFTISNVIINGSYNDPRFALVGTDATCFNGNDGTISVTGLQNGRAPFSYTLVAPSPMGVGTTNNTGVFTGLIPGEYAVQLKDSCGGMQTRNISVQNYDWSITSVPVTLVNCTVYHTVINLVDSKGNTSGVAFTGFQYGIVNSVGDTSWYNANAFDFDILQKRTVTLVVKDRCGRVKSTNWTNANRPAVFANVTINNQICTGFDATVTGQQNLTNPTYCLINSLGATVSCNATGVFTNLPYGSYSINITNTCYDTVITRAFSQVQAIPAITGSVNISNYNCTDVTATVTGQQNLTNPTYCLINDLGVQVGACNGTGVFNNVPYGNYSVNITDGCTATVFTRSFSAIKRTRSVAANASVSGNTCTTFNATITGQTNLTNPQYCLVDNLGNPISCNSTGVFTNISYGSYCINITDACADTTIQRCVNVSRPVPTLSGATVSNRTCTGFTATITGQANLFSGALYCLVDNLGNPVVGIPCNTTGVFTNIPYGSYCVQTTDNCSGTVLTNCFTATNPTPAVGAVNITNKTCSGYTATLAGQSYLTNPSFCLYDDLNNQVGVCNSTGVFNNVPYGSYHITTTDGCAGTIFNTNFSVTKPVPSVAATVNFSNQNCTTFTADITGETNLTSPLYSLKDTSGTVIANNTTGTFNNIPYGSYSIDIANSCLDTTITRSFTVNGNPTLMTVSAAPSCTLYASDLTINVSSGFSPYTVNIYDASNNLVRTTTSASNNINVSGLPTLVIGETFRVVVSGTCGTPATQFVSATRSSLTHSYTVTPKCPSGAWQNGSADLLVVATTNLAAVNMSITQKNFAPASIGYAFRSGNNFNFSNLEPATYVISYTFSGCALVVNDTMVVSTYQFPNLSKSAAYQCDNNSFSVGASVTGGVSPYTYEVIGSTPSLPSLITGSQASPVFGINNGVEYSLVRLRAIDACGNATLNDVSILPLANIIVTSTSNCFYNDITLTTDTVPNASYIWYKKTSATDSVQVGSTVGFNVPYLQPSDTGTYVSRMSVNSGCLTKLAYYHLDGSCGGFILLPVKVTLSGKAASNDAVQLSWVAKDEQTTKKYIVERSANKDAGFEAIGSLNGKQSATSSSYVFGDSKAIKGTNYYRLRIEDADGKFTYSNVIVIKITDANSISVYPNPVSDILNINISGKQNQSYRLTIYNAAGQSIYSNMQQNIQSNTIQYKRSSTVKPGFYILQVVNMSTGENSSYKLLFE